MTYKPVYSIIASSAALGLLSLWYVKQEAPEVQCAITDADLALRQGSIRAKQLTASEHLGLSSSTLAHSSTFLNAYIADHKSGSWLIDHNGFTTPISSKTKGKPCIQLLRLKARYKPLQSDLSPVPFMRVFGFLPGVSATEVYVHMTDLNLRKKWDTNYRMFERFTTEQVSSNDAMGRNIGKQSGTASLVAGGGGNGPEKLPTLMVDGIERPVFSVIQPNQCEGGLCNRVPKIKRELVDQGWFCHTVGSNFLSRLGFAFRFFVYERISYQYRLVDEENNGPDKLPGTTCKQAARDFPLIAYDVLYAGSRQDVDLASKPCYALNRWIKAKRKEAADQVNVELNYLHLMLLPIADYQIQIEGNSRSLMKQLSESGSMNDQDATRCWYKIFKESAQILAEAREKNSTSDEALGDRSGVLVVMTSANDVGLSKSVPQIVQSALATTVSREAYSNLMKACRTSSA